MAGNTQGTYVDPVGVSALLARLGGQESLLGGARVVDERTGKKQRAFDTDARHFTGSSNLASALELARRCGNGIKDAHTVVRSLDTDFAELITKAATAVRGAGGADTASADVVDRTGQAW
ncbi:hypothetical protein R8Z50_30185 [Longispora sp. K20-0274]|uniref:hypothetical protein n=1 Tax=Longispora sp. K20-0274 TaxID=3088255 RepID=UPI00399966F5